MPAILRSDADVAASVTCILSDVDGVMTDGSIIYDSNGCETKQFSVRDGLGIKRWMQAGFEFGIITARNSEMVHRRATELGIKHLSQGQGGKLERAEAMIHEMGCRFENVCYIGDDLPDLPVMQRAAIGAAPADAAHDARERAHWVLRSEGGKGAVREVVERLMRARDLWNPDLA